MAKRTQIKVIDKQIYYLTWLILYTFWRRDRLIKNTELIFFQAPNLTANRAKSEFTAGETLGLTCRTPYDCNTYRFFLNDKKFYDSNGVNHVDNSNLKPKDSGSYTCDCVLAAGTTPKSNVVSITVGKLTILISFQSPRQKHPLPKCSDKQDRPRTNKAISMMCGKPPWSNVEI